jgi:hypothetical protein
MKLWRLIPVVAFVGVLAAATVGLATVQNIDEDHNYASEGERDARDCDGFEVEYGQDNGHVDRVKLFYAASEPRTNLNDGDCGDQFIKVEVHNDRHRILGECAVFQLPTTGEAQCDLDPFIFNQPDCFIGRNCVADIAHINLVVTDLNSIP